MGKEFVLPDDIREINETIDTLKKCQECLRKNLKNVESKKEYYDKIITDLYHHIELENLDAIGLMKDAMALRNALKLRSQYILIDKFLKSYLLGESVPEKSVKGYYVKKSELYKPQSVADTEEYENVEEV